MGTTHFSGVTNVAESATLGTYVAPDPAKAHQYFNDFDTYLATDWTITGTSTVAMAALDGGAITVTNGAGDDALGALQGAQSFLGALNKNLWFRTSLKVSDALQSDVIAGLYITAAAPIATPPTAGIYFLKADGAATVDFIVKHASVASTQTAVATLTSDTFVNLGFVYDKDAGVVRAFVNDNQVASLPVTNFPAADLMRASFAVQNGEAVAKILTVDHIFAAKQRDAESA